MAVSRHQLESSKDTLLFYFSPLYILRATPADNVISYSIINVNVSVLTCTENYLLFQ